MLKIRNINIKLKLNITLNEDLTILNASIL
jgi:hypothetical protein